MGRDPGTPEFAFQNVLGPALGATPVRSKGLQQRLLWIHWSLGGRDPSEVTRMWGGHLPVTFSGKGA